MELLAAAQTPEEREQRERGIEQAIHWEDMDEGRHALLDKVLALPVEDVATTLQWLEEIEERSHGGEAWGGKGRPPKLESHALRSHGFVIPIDTACQDLRVQPLREVQPRHQSWVQQVE